MMPIVDKPAIQYIIEELVVSERPCIGQMIDHYNRYGSSILAVKEVPQERISSYGVIKAKRINDVYLVEGLVEKPDPAKAPSNLATLGRYIFGPEIFDFLEQIEPAENGEYQLTDAIELMIQSQAVYACAIEGEWHTVGDLLSYLKTSVAFSLNHPAIAKDFRKYLKELAPQLEEDPSSEKKPL